MFSVLLQAEEIPFSVVATGDLHSRFEPYVDPYHLGGSARLKGAMDTITAELKEKGVPVLRLDAGDSSEGSLFYNLGEGLVSYELFNSVGYSAGVIGNHDWYMGPDGLNTVLTKIASTFSFLSANLNWEKAPNHPLKNKIKPYEIFYKVGNRFLRSGEAGFIPDSKISYFKIGVLGLSTDEFLFSFYFEPVKVGRPLKDALMQVRQLREKENVDVVIILSHLEDKTDIYLAEHVTSVDLIIGGHSHNKVIPVQGKPIEILRKDDDDNRANTWLVKTGEFGQFFGRMDLVYDTDKKGMVWKKSHYDLLQVDDRYTPDRNIQAKVDYFKTELVKKYNDEPHPKIDVFSDTVGTTDVDLFKNSFSESPLGNLLTNALLEIGEKSGAQMALSASELFTHGMYRGTIHSSLLYDILPHVYKTATDKSWTVWTFEGNGKMLKSAMNKVLAFGFFFDTAGINLIYDPKKDPEQVVSLMHENKELDPDKNYVVVTSQGIIKALELIQRAYPELKFKMTDTGMGVWDALEKYVKAHSPILSSSPEIAVTGRMRTVQSDLSVVNNEVTVERGKTNTNLVTVSAYVHNLGAYYQSEETLATFYYDATPDNAVDNIAVFRLRTLFPREFSTWNPSLMDKTLPKNVIKITSVRVPPLVPGVKARISADWDISNLPFSKVPYTLYVHVDPSSGTMINTPNLALRGQENGVLAAKIDEVNIENNNTMIYFEHQNPDKNK